MRPFTSMTVLAGLILFGNGPSSAQQDRSFGVNARVGGGGGVGFTYAASGRVAIRPAVSFYRYTATRRTVPTPQEFSTTEVTLDLDLLFGNLAGPGLRSYLGLGGSFGGNWRDGDGAVVWGVGVLVGLQLRVLDRMAVFAESGARYDRSGSDGTSSWSRLHLDSSSLGVVLYVG